MNREEIIKRLQSYKKLKAEHDGIVAQINELAEDRAQLRSPRLDGMPHGGSTSDPTAAAAERLIELTARYKASASDLCQRMCEIENAISIVPDSLQREMLRAHYLRGQSWDNIAKEKAYSVSQCKQLAGKGINYICESVYTSVRMNVV